MRISVVMPLYNKRAYVERAIESVLTQSVQDFELIVVDDGSSDGSGEIVRMYDDRRIRYFWQENRGECAARNTGISYAKSDLLAFLDADDEYNPQFIETILRLYKRYPGAGIYSTAYQIADNYRKIVPSYIGLPGFPWEGVVPDYFKSSYPPIVTSSSSAVPKLVFDSVGAFPVGVALGGDSDTWFRIALNYPVVFSNYIGSTYYLNAQNRSCDRFCFPKEYIATMTSALDSGRIDVKNIDDVKKMIDEQVITAAARYSLAGNGGQARLLLHGTRGRAYLMRKLKWYLLSYLPANLLWIGLWIKAAVRNCLRKLFVIVRCDNE